LTHARTSTSPNHWDSGAQSVHRRINSSLWAGTEIALLTGGFDRPYAYGLAMALSSKGLGLDVIGSDEIDSPEMHTTPKVKFLNLHGSRREASLANRIWRELTFYLRLIRYAKTATPRIFHILWNNRLQVFDRTLLMLYYKLLGKKLVLTAHNVNAGRRDLNDSPLNRLTLKIQYRLVDHIFVHTDQMKAALSEEFAIRGEKVTVIPFGINNSVPSTDLTPEEAKRRLGIKNMEKTILFFGALRPYKGLECLVAAFQRIAAAHEGYRLIVAAEPKKRTRVVRISYNGWSLFLTKEQKFISRRLTFSYCLTSRSSRVAFFSCPTTLACPWLPRMWDRSGTISWKERRAS